MTGGRAAHGVAGASRNGETKLRRSGFTRFMSDVESTRDRRWWAGFSIWSNGMRETTCLEHGFSNRLRGGANSSSKRPGVSSNP